LLDAIILDTETTTNKDTPERPLEVVELAWRYLDPAAAGDCYRYKPRLPPTFGATAVHHILMSELQDCPPSTQAPFGKFKDQPIAAADRGYASWCARQPDFDPYVIVALKRAGLLR